jgi:hypothetical protein
MVLVVYRAYFVVTLDKQLNLAQIQFTHFLLGQKLKRIFSRPEILGQ